MGERAHPPRHDNRVARESRQAASSWGWGSRRARRPATEGRERLSLMWPFDTSVSILLINRTDAGKGVRF